MFYRLSDDAIFRQYEEYGYISDNSEYGYRMLNDQKKVLGEKYLSASGAVMVAQLGRIPKEISDIVKNLMEVFIDVDYDVLLQDTIEFFEYLKNLGYIVSAPTANECIQQGSLLVCDNNKVTTIKEDNEDYSDRISQKDFLRSLHIEIANTCNERCVHCYIPHKSKISIIDSALFYRIIEEGRRLNIIHVTLSGGEPLMHKDIIGFLRKCRELDLAVNVLSNLTLLTNEIIEEMQCNHLLSVQTSLYSMVPSVHDGITKLSGSFIKTRDSILKLCSAGIPVQISCPIMKQNKDSFQDVISWAESNNIGVALEPEIFATYDRSCSNLQNRLSYEEMSMVLDKQMSLGYAEQFHNTATEKEAYSENDPICSICRYHFCITAEGLAFPCAGWQSNIIGDLNTQSIEEIWTTSLKINEFRKLKRKDFPKCVDCADRGYCTVCMMANANEDPEGNPFNIRELHCRLASLTHKKVKEKLA